MEKKINEIVLFETEDKEIKLSVPVENETVWLTQAQMTELFGRNVSTISRHITSIFNMKEVEEKSNLHFLQIANSDKPVAYYSLDVIISVGYRVKSQRGIEFRRWANKILKDYIIRGYAINDKRLQALQKTVEIQTKIIANTLELEHEDVLKAVNMYTQALTLLDRYDHQSLEKPEGEDPVYRLTYEDCRKMINHMEGTFKSDVFGVEKEKGKVEGILAAVYQNVFGGDVYPSLEEKAANLLYFMIKDHPFADGCKRIAASLFLEFLDRNKALFRDGQKIISDGALVAITLLIAESDPKEKDIMTTLVMNLLKI